MSKERNRLPKKNGERERERLGSRSRYRQLRHLAVIFKIVMRAVLNCIMPDVAIHLTLRI